MIVVLGGGIDGDGNLPIWVNSRLEKAIQLYREKESWILLSGKGKDGHQVTEAESMAQYLIERNIPSNKILLECLSEDTVQNAYFSRTLHIDPMGVKQFTLVTSAFHMKRSHHIFEWVFGTAYDIDCAPASDEEIIEADLNDRKQIELELLNFHTTVLQGIPSGDLLQLHQFIFNKSSDFASSYRRFTRKFKNARSLY